MDENEWSYHGEGNKSLVVAHAQVSVWRAGGTAPGLTRRTTPAALCLVPSSLGRDSSSSFRSGGSLEPPQYPPRLHTHPRHP